MPGKGQIKTTGKLGEVMQESIQAAMSFVKARAPSYGVKPSIFARKDIHVHLPEGAVPKDGPSAGIGMVTAMISTLTGIPVRRDVAMTGEVTLRGRVLPIGGLKEKLLAALRGGITTVLIPAENEKDLAEIPASVKEALEIMPVAHVDEVLARALAEPMRPIEWTDADEHAAEPPVPPLVRRNRATGSSLGRWRTSTSRALTSPPKIALKTGVLGRASLARVREQREHEQAGTDRPCRGSCRAATATMPAARSRPCSRSSPRP